MGFLLSLQGVHAPSVVSLPAVLLAPGLTPGVHAPSNYQPAPSSGAATVFAHAYLQGVAIPGVIAASGTCRHLRWKGTKGLIFKTP